MKLEIDLMHFTGYMADVRLLWWREARWLQVCFQVVEAPTGSLGTLGSVVFGMS